jgi:hypothetical protein
MGMSVAHLIAMSTHPGERAVSASRISNDGVRELIRRCSPADFVIFGYLFVLLAASVAGSGPLRSSCIAITATLLLTFVVTLAWTRGPSRPRLAPYAYRGVILTSLAGSYFLLRWLLPTARTAAYDRELLHVDRLIFRVEPTVWLERFVTPARTEWFAAFYLSYFAVLTIHVLPMLFLSRERRLVSELGIATVLMMCVGSALYLVVPGFGPYRTVDYSVALPTGPVQRFLLDTVENAGAMKDIFPSLHTAFPTMFALFAFRHRAQTPWRYTWPVIVFFACNIIAATIYLRWHYAIDVLAGLAFAGIVSYASPRIAAREETRRMAAGLGPDWPSLP